MAKKNVWDKDKKKNVIPSEGVKGVVKDKEFTVKKKSSSAPKDETAKAATSGSKGKTLSYDFSQPSTYTGDDDSFIRQTRANAYGRDSIDLYNNLVQNYGNVFNNIYALGGSNDIKASGMPGKLKYNQSWRDLGAEWFNEGVNDLGLSEEDVRLMAEITEQNNRFADEWGNLLSARTGDTSVLNTEGASKEQLAEYNRMLRLAGRDSTFETLSTPLDATRKAYRAPGADDDEWESWLQNYLNEGKKTGIGAWAIFGGNKEAKEREDVWNAVAGEKKTWDDIAQMHYRYSTADLRDDLLLISGKDSNFRYTHRPFKNNAERAAAVQAATYRASAATGQDVGTLMREDPSAIAKLTEAYRAEDEQVYGYLNATSGLPGAISSYEEYYDNIEGTGKYQEELAGIMRTQERYEKETEKAHRLSASVREDPEYSTRATYRQYTDHGGVSVEPTIMSGMMDYEGGLTNEQYQNYHAGVLLNEYVHAGKNEDKIAELDMILRGVPQIANNVDLNHVKHLSPEQQQDVYALINKAVENYEFPQEAIDYINDPSVSYLAQRNYSIDEQTKYQKNIENDGATAAVEYGLSFLRNAPNALAGYVNTVRGIIDPEFRENMSPYDVAFENAWKMQTAQGNVANKAEAWGEQVEAPLIGDLGDAARFGAEAVNSIGNMLAQSAMGGKAKALTLGNMYANTFNTAWYNNLMRGDGDFLDAVAEGAFEVATEAAPLDIIADKAINPWDKLWKTGVAEAIGEADTSLLNMGWDAARYGEYREWTDYENMLHAQGYSPEEIQKEKVKFFAGSLIKDAAMGAFIGAGFAAPSAVADYSGMRKEGKNIIGNEGVADLVKVAESVGLDGSNAKILADIKAALGVDEANSEITDEQIMEEAAEPIGNENVVSEATNAEPVQIDTQSVIDRAMEAVSGKVNSDVSAAVENAVNEAAEFLADDAADNGGVNSDNAINNAVIVAQEALGEVEGADAEVVKNAIAEAVKGSMRPQENAQGVQETAEGIANDNGSSEGVELDSAEAMKFDPEAAKKAAARQALDEIDSMEGVENMSEEQRFEALITRTAEIFEQMKAEAEQAAQKSEQNTNKQTERSENSASDIEAEAADAVQEAEQNARDKQERADQQRNADVGSVVPPEQAKTARDKGERSSKGKRSKGGKISPAKVGQLYRASMAKLDAQAQEVMSTAYARTLEGQLSEKGITGDAAKTISKQLADVIGGRKSTPYITNLINNNAVVRQIYLDSMAKVNTTELDKANLEYMASGIRSKASPAAVKPENLTVDEIEIEAEEGDAPADIVTKNAQKYLGAQAVTMENMYNDTQDAVKYSEAFVRAVNYGRDGRNLDIVKGEGRISTLNEAQIEAAYAIGRDMRVNAPTAARVNSKGISVGNVDLSEINLGTLDKHQKASVHAAIKLAKAIGFNLKFVESKANALGQYTTENGSWTPETMTLTLDIHAGSNDVGDHSYAMMHTMGHELTHYIKQFADGGMWNEYQAFVMDHLSTKMNNDMLDDKIAKLIAKAKEDGRTLTRDGAIEEIIADASVEALMNITDADIQQIAETNPSLLKKIGEFIQKWIKDIKAAIKAAYSGTESKTALARAMEDQLDEMSARWNKLLVNAAQNRAAEAKGATVAENASVAETAQKPEAQKESTPEADVKYCVRDGRLSADSTEQERYEILKNGTVKLASVNIARVKEFGENLGELNKTAVVGTIKTVAKNLGINRISLYNSKLDMGFGFSLKNVKKSATHQADYGGSYPDLAKAMSCIEQLAENAVPIEVHREKKTGTKKANHDLKNVYVLVSAFADGNGYIPVQMEVKEFYNRDTGLYLNVALNKIEPDVWNTRRLPENQEGLTYLLPDSVIRIAEIFKNVNPDTDGRFLKYVPDGFLNDEQKASKQRALAKQEEEYAGYGEAEKFSMRSPADNPQTETAAFKNWFGDSKIVNADGSPKVMYHGTPYGGFTVFKDWQYFTDNPEYADVYQEPSASSIRGRYNPATNPQTYAVYLNVQKPFDTRDPKIRKIWQEEFYNNYSRTPLSEKGLPDWTDGIDLVEFIEENDYDFDAIILDEGAVGGYGDEVQSRGVSVVVRNSNQIKSATDNIGTFDPSNPDIRYQQRDLSELSDRELLVQALEGELSPEERDHLQRYKDRVEDIAKKQMQLEAINSEIVELRRNGATAKNSDELRKKMTNAKTLRASIDRVDAKLAQIESARMIQEVVKRNRAEASKKAYALARERADERQRKAVEHAREVGQRKVDRMKESQGKEKYKAQIMKDVKKLHTWLTTPSMKGSVPQFLRKPVADFLESIDFTSDRALKGGEATKNDQKFADALDALRRAVGEINKQQGDIEAGAADFAGYIDLPADYMAEFDDLVGRIKTTLGMGYATVAPFNRMTADQLHELSKMFRVLNSSISKANRLIANVRYESAKAASNDTIDDMNSMKAKVKTNKALELLNSTFNWKNTTPYYAFQRLGRGGKAIFEGLQDGWDKMARNSAKLIEFAKNTFTGKESKAWGSDVSEIRLDSGDTIQMTTAQKMSLYCHTKRAQSMGHLLGGGIRISDIDTKRGGTISQVDNHVITEADIARITGSLTARQKAVADALQKFMNTVCKDWGNEISMKRFGYEQMTEDNYFPIETDANNRARIDDTKDGKNSMFRLLNMSSLKPLTPKANNAIIIRNIFDVFSNHAVDMAKYNALALPILDYIKWYNYVERTDVVDASGNATGQIKTRSTQKALERAFGVNAKDYLNAFIKDLNAEHDGGRNDGLINKMIGRAKSAAVGANLRVFFLQITSLPRAAYAINPKYLAQGLLKLKSLNPANAIKGTEAQEEIGILQWKDLGFYSTDINNSVRDMVKRDGGVLDKVRDAQMAPAGWGDNWVGNIIYEAAKAEMADKHPNVQPGTNAYKTLLNRRVREIVYKTQVVDSTMTRSDFMRSKGLASMLTAFMSEPTLTVNMLNESIQEAVAMHRGGASTRDILRANSGKVVRAASTFTVTAFLTAALEAAFDAMRDDDDYEEFFEKYRAAFGGNVLDNVNVFAMLPYLKDIISIFQGFENSSMITQGWQQLQDFKTAIEAWQEGKRPIYSVVYNGAKAASSLTGFAAGNALRDFASIYNTVLADAWGTPKLQTYEDSKSAAANAYYTALQSGDADKLAWIQERAEVNGIAMEDISEKIGTLVKNDFAAGNITEEEAVDRLVEFSGKDADDAYWKVQEWSAGEDNYSKYSNLRSALSSGDSGAANAAYRELVEHGVDEKTISSELTKLYNSGEATSILNLQMRGERLYTSNLKLKTDGEKHPDDFDSFVDAIVNGSGVSSEIQALLDKGYTVKQCMSAINGAFGNSSDRYRIMEKYNSADARILLNRILDAYEALGLDRGEEMAWIDANWIM